MNRLPLLLPLLALSAPASAAPLRQPAGPWVVDYAETLCSATRLYGSGKNGVTLAFRPSPGGTVVRLALGRTAHSGPPRHFPVQLNGKAGATTALRFAGEGKGKRQIVWINFDRSELDSVASAAEISVKGEGLDERFALPGFAKVLAALDACNADLRRHWNFDERSALTREAAPVKPLASYVSDRDYPYQALEERAGGTTRVALMIDPAGAPADCMVEQASGIATLDVMACAVFLERAKFTPALGADGKPARSILTTRIMWRTR